MTATQPNPEPRSGPLNLAPGATLPPMSDLLEECRCLQSESARLRWHLDAVLNQRERLRLADGIPVGAILYIDGVFKAARAALQQTGADA